MVIEDVFTYDQKREIVERSASHRAIGGQCLTTEAVHAGRWAVRLTRTAQPTHHPHR